MASRGCCSDCASTFTRKKPITADTMKTNLRRCLNTLDLTLMGVGSMVGTGIFVLTGQVARYDAGASVVLSYVLAGVAAAMSAMCYAEFASSVPLSGSSYSYTYVVVGELWAFLVGWNVILENIIGTSAAAKSWSGTLDSLCGGAIASGIQDLTGVFHEEYISPYPDLVAAAVVLLVMVFVLIGAKSSANFNKVMVAVKLLVIAVIIIAGFTLADLSNWTDPDKGGFFPYGAAGTLSGAATCYYAFIGFDSLSTASEETKDPKKSLPVAILGSLVIVTSLYILSAMTLTLMVPYNEIDPVSGFTAAFVQRGNLWATFVVGIGTLFGLATVIMAGLFCVPRVLYAMSNDGLIFGFLGYVHPKTQTPMTAILLTGVISAVLAVFFQLEVLVNLMSIGTLFCYTFVAVSIIVIRYSELDIHLDATADGAAVKEDAKEGIPLKRNGIAPANYASVSTLSSEEPLKPAADPDTNKSSLHQRTREALGRWKKSEVVIRLILIMAFSMLLFLLLLFYGLDNIIAANWWIIVLMTLISAAILIPLLLMASLEQCPKRDYFQVPLVPLVPALSIFCNFGLMLMLGWATWIRLLVWIALGLIVYYSYGMTHSKARPDQLSAYCELEPSDTKTAS